MSRFVVVVFVVVFVIVVFVVVIIVFSFGAFRARMHCEVWLNK